MNDIARRVKRSFLEKFGGEPVLISSPGRVNLIGEHTDYNEGFVLPGATDRAIILALAPREDDSCRFYACDFNQDFSTSLDHLKKSDLHWPDYLQGVLKVFLETGYRIRGLDVAFGGNVPIGGGMSSSAAIEGGLAFALNYLFNLGLDRLILARLARQAENDFVGVKCGIMDMFANLYGQPEKVMKIDCRSLEYEFFPFEQEDIRIVISDSRVRRELASSEYNLRRQQCEAGVSLLKHYYPEIKSLRDVSLSRLVAHQTEFVPVVFKRCVYVIKENQRVEQACQDLLQQDLVSFGQRMYESHSGLRDEYEVSCPELDLLVESASRVPGVYGSRLMGAGFGGCTISLVRAPAVKLFEERVSADYRQATGKDPAIHVVRIEAGTRVI
ncbi:MAG: galactokinase [Acidobacteriota bacterium]|nr:galactokinase [Acidobacteriota bacterium]